AAARLARVGGDTVRRESFQEPGVLDRYPDLSREDCMREMKLVHDDGRVEGGADAVRATLALRPAWRWLATLLGAPGLRALSRLAYGAVARHRYRLFGVTCPDGACDLHGRVDESARALEGDYRPTARLFLSALGLVYLLVFVSLAAQAQVLIGSDGLLPVREFLAARGGDGPARFLRLPTLFWLWDGDAAVRGGTILGVALALGLMAGIQLRLCLVGLWLLFLSYVTAGRDFFWFQWDTLLLESTVLALLLPRRPETPPHPIVIFLFRWLVFRLLFESGLAKVQAGAASWFPLTAMAYYYETAPLPSLAGWYAHQLPLWAHRWTAALTLLGELLVPLLVWGGRPARRIACALILAFQVSIHATANYGYFNVLSLVLALFLLDGRDLGRWPRWLQGVPSPSGRAWPRAGAVARLGVAVAGGAIFVLTILELMVLVAGQGVAASPALVAVRDAVLPYRVAGKYHLFAHVDPRRIEAEIEWTADGQTWRAYEFHYKPGPLDRAPPTVAPHQPRVDFQLWFFTMGRDGGVHDHFNNLVRRLCSGSATVQGLFDPRSVPPAPPLAIRVAYHRYRMTDRATLAREGRYWSRELVDYHPIAYFCDSSAPPRF
ncbi:MAG TPA: lipase maturation factor family protein, partial [Candidatus Limnocylindrales bacterium]|nr:lipase maturation factor family protein [Candidatus Limnocylindrales bacterium]